MELFEDYTIEVRKSNGIFYTPDFLANYLAKKALFYAKESSIVTVLDPACGESILLQTFKEEISNTDFSSKNIHYIGIDTDVNAISNSTINFAKENQYCDFFVADGLFPKANIESKEDWKSLKLELGIKEGFDIILSNPPWGSNLESYSTGLLAHNFILAKGQFDIYDLFVESIIHNLKDGGIYGLILPDSLFNQEHAKLRRFLLENTEICLISRLGEKIFEGVSMACVVLIGKKGTAKQNHKVDCVRLNAVHRKQILSKSLSLENIEKDLVHQILQQRFSENEDVEFDIDLRTNENRIFKKLLSDSTLLSKLVTNTRGAEISKKGEAIQCYNCEQWMPTPRTSTVKCNHCKIALDITRTTNETIILNHNGFGNLKIKVGEDLFRFTSISKSWINTLKPGINYKNLKLYEGAKILVRKTGVGITASLDYDNSITNQVVYILKLRSQIKSGLTLEFILAVLNSRVLTYFLLKKYGETEWKSHPYLTQTMLNNLPFPKIDINLAKNKEIINNISTIVKEEVTNSKEKNISKKNDLYIEYCIAMLWGLTKEDYKFIFEALESADQLIPIRRLLNCTIEEIFNQNGI